MALPPPPITAGDAFGPMMASIQVRARSRGRTEPSFLSRTKLLSATSIAVLSLSSLRSEVESSSPLADVPKRRLSRRMRRTLSPITASEMMPQRTAGSNVVREGHLQVKAILRSSYAVVNRIPVRHDDAVKAPLLLGEFVIHPPVFGRVNPVDKVVGVHDCGYRSEEHRGLENRQVEFT